MIQSNQSGGQLTTAELGSTAHLGIKPFQSVNIRNGLGALGPGLLMAGPLIAAAAFATMFSTTQTVIEGYSRSLELSSKMVFASLEDMPKLYTLWMILICLAAFVLILLFVDSLTDLIDLVTVAAFLAAPVYGYLNYRLITSIHTPEALQLGLCMRVLNWAGLGFFVLVGLTFLLYRVTALAG